MGTPSSFACLTNCHGELCEFLARNGKGGVSFERVHHASPFALEGSENAILDKRYAIAQIQSRTRRLPDGRHAVRSGQEKMGNAVLSQEIVEFHIGECILARLDEAVSRDQSQVLWGSAIAVHFLHHEPRGGSGERVHALLMSVEHHNVGSESDLR